MLPGMWKACNIAWQPTGLTTVTTQDLRTGLCACGSGLRASRCCTLDAAALPNQDSTALLDVQAAEATKFFNEKKYDEAEALALKLLDMAPNQRMALRVLYEIRKGQNNGAATEALGARLAGLPGPAQSRAAANIQFAQYLVSKGRHAEAHGPAAAAVIATPKDATVHHVMGVVLTETGRVLPGERHYRLALKLLGREDGLVTANLAWNLKLQGRLDEAAALYETALARNAENKRGIGGAVQVEFMRGNREKAIALLDGALARWPDERTLRLLRVLTDLAMDQPQAVLDRLGPPEALLPPELLARGQAFARLGQVQDAIVHYATARRTQRERGLAYQPEPFQARAESYKAYFTADRVQPLPRADAGAFQPVFLLGFPRSGASLLEQMLMSLPGFTAGDEAAPVADLIDAIPGLTGSDTAYPTVLDEFMVGDAAELPNQLRALYERRRVRSGLLRPGVKFITDRAVSNLWHLGLIKLLYPEAPIIHVLRHPYDVVLSSFAQDRKMEGNCQAGMPALARHYALSMGMVKHYRGQLTLRYLPVRYEDLVATPSAVLRQVLDFVGSDAPVPNATALATNAAPMQEPVPAHVVAREALHSRAVWRHQTYLAAMPNLFSEVREVLAPWIEMLGYREEAAP
jgi:tetratricopeptide (TPR) repeat protein